MSVLCCCCCANLHAPARELYPLIHLVTECNVCSCRGDVSSGVSDRVLSQLLTELDGVHVRLLVYRVCYATCDIAD